MFLFSKTILKVHVFSCYLSPINFVQNRIIYLFFNNTFFRENTNQHEAYSEDPKLN